jgi:hypothetical protein
MAVLIFACQAAIAAESRSPAPSRRCGEVGVFVVVT